MNHFRNNDSYTTKSGLSKKLKNLISKDVDIDQYFPKFYEKVYCGFNDDFYQRKRGLKSFNDLVT